MIEMFVRTKHKIDKSHEFALVVVNNDVTWVGTLARDVTQMAGCPSLPCLPRLRPDGLLRTDLPGRVCPLVPPRQGFPAVSLAETVTGVGIRASAFIP